MKTHCTVCALVAVALPGAAFGGAIRADRDPQLYLDLAAAYPSVGRIDTVGTDGRFIGSGTLIAPEWVLTAGHMVDKVTSMTFDLGGRVYTAASWVANPNWRGNLGTGTDIALVKLSSAVTDVAPAARYTGTSELGAVGTFVGFGMTGTGITGATSFDGLKRAGQNVLDAYYQSGRKSVASLLMSDFDSPTSAAESRYGSASPLNLEYLIAPGDSGGGVFADLGGGRYLVGVNSFGAAWDGNVDSDYGDASGVTRVSSFNSWIDAVMSGTSGGGKGKPGRTSLEAGFGMAVVPEPASLTLLGLGAAAVLLRGRRKS